MLWILLVIILFLASFAYAGLKGAPWVPSRRNDVERFLQLANIQSGDVFYDFGSGDGRMLVAAAGAGAEAYGYELSLLPYLLSQIRRFFSKDKNRIHVYFKDFRHGDCGQATLVYLFLTPSAYTRLKTTFEKELKPGTRVVAYVWPIEGWKSTAVDSLEGRPTMYLYTR